MYVWILETDTDAGAIGWWGSVLHKCTLRYVKAKKAKSNQNSICKSLRSFIDIFIFFFSSSEKSHPKAS